MDSQHYRPDIDGLRALAILVVVGFHAFPEWLPGGFIGVDIFFVISGYLITTVIVDEIDRGRFSFATFYGRRIRRIFPALSVVLLGCFAAGWYVMLEDEFVQVTRHIAAGAGFLSNFQLWSEAGYFDRAAETKPLQHLWSLGVEEQFYIAWPLMMVLIVRRRLPLLTAVTALMCLSFIANIFFIQQDRIAVFYSPLTRIWELAVGGLLACMLRRYDLGRAIEASLWANSLGIVGATFVVIALAALDQTRLFPGWWAALPVLGATLMIAAGENALTNKYILSNRLMVFIGLISYPLYLWHWPLLTFLRLTYPGVLGAVPRGAAVGFAFVAATATYLFIERPIRRNGLTKRLVGNLFATAMIVGLVGLASSLLQWPPRMSGQDLTQVVNAVHDWNYPTPGFRSFYHDGLRYYRKDSSLGSTTMFVGDSNMEQYAPRIDVVIRRHPGTSHSAVFVTRGGCLPIPAFYDQAEWVCRKKMQAIAELAADPQVSAIVFGAEWGVIASLPNPQVYVESLRDMLMRLSGTKRVYLILSMPEGAAFDPRSMFEGSRFTQLHVRKGAAEVDIAEVTRQQSPIRGWLIDTATQSGAIVIDPLPALCPQARCPTRAENGDPLYLDRDHMRPFHVIERADFLDQTLRMPASR